MVDYAIDGQFNAVRTDWGAFKTVSGLKEFEQNLGVALDVEMGELLNNPSRGQNVEEKIRLAVHRIARDFDVIGEVRNVEVSQVIGEDAGYRVEIKYATAGRFREIF